ncbi:Cacna1i [Symbiodinium sp. CCMP2456]|nr:Cacna1i [Symbiodinium sp. CCMP2456]
MLAAEILGVDLIEDPFLVPPLKLALPALAAAFQRGELNEDSVDEIYKALASARASAKTEEAEAEEGPASPGVQNCEECDAPAIWHCPACEGSFCGSCFDKLHARGRRAEHPRLDLAYAGFKMKRDEVRARKQVVNIRWHAFYDAQGLKFYYNFESQQSLRKLSAKELAWQPPPPLPVGADLSIGAKRGAGAQVQNFEALSDGSGSTESWKFRQTAASIELVPPSVVVTDVDSDGPTSTRVVSFEFAAEPELEPAPRKSRFDGKARFTRVSKRDPDAMKELRKTIQQKAEEYEWRAADYGNKASEVAKAMKLDVRGLEGSRLTMHRWISWAGFDTIIGLVIMVNAVTIGVEAHYNASIPVGCTASCACDIGILDACAVVPPWLTYLDYVFFLVYVTEFAMRYYAYGRAVLRSNWVKFDLFLIVSSAVDLTLNLVNVQNELLNQVMLVRILRLLRLARAVRLIVLFQTLWQLVQGLLHSVTTLFWTFLLVMILIYIFAIIGMEFISEDPALDANHEYNVAARENFSNFGDAIMTLLQMFSMDSIGAVYRPLVKHRRCGSNLQLMAYAVILGWVLLLLGLAASRL